jgi:hypothetical protein
MGRMTLRRRWKNKDVMEMEEERCDGAPWILNEDG